MPFIRPPPTRRKFVSPIIDDVIANISSRMIDSDLAILFMNTWPSTLDTTVFQFTAKNASKNATVTLPDAFIITGDITAQWLRDSTNQLLPYLPYITQDNKLAQLFCGLIRRQAHDVLLDPYANSFNIAATGEGHQDDTRKPKMTPSVFEGKYELDSLAAALKLSWHYFDATADAECFALDGVWLQAMSLAVNTMIAQQAPTVRAQYSNYVFGRQTTAATDTLQMDGVGPAGRYTGMSRSAFRPSDDATTLPFLIPAEAMAVVELRHLALMLRNLSTNALVSPSQRSVYLSLASNASTLATEIDAGIKFYGIVPVPAIAQDLFIENPQLTSKNMFAYEVDGYGGQLLMDDANIPSLLALPMLGYLDASDPVYQTTRAFILSAHNPFFFQGSASRIGGIGGPHVGLDYVWPMSLIARAATSSNETEIVECLVELKASSVNTGWLHESFERNDATKFTRTWFSWVNGLFGSLILQLAEQRPHLIFGGAPEMLSAE